MPTITASTNGPAFELTDDWVEKVANNPDDELRAHQIILTLSYVAVHLDELIHQSSSQERQRLGDVTATNANWFHFAVGDVDRLHHIGNERAPQRLNSGVGGTAATAPHPVDPAHQGVRRAAVGPGPGLGAAADLPVRCAGRCRGSFETPLLPVPPAGGEPLVLNEVSSVSFRQGPGLIDDFLGDFLGDLGDTDRRELKEQRHVEPMRRAFALYRLASQLGHDEEAERQRSQLVLGANLLLTAVEQDLVDPALSIVVDLVPNSAAEAVSWRLAKVAERVRGVPPHLSYLMLLNMRTGERRAIDTVWSRLMTDQVLVMALPTETLRLGRDIPPATVAARTTPPRCAASPSASERPPPSPTITSRRRTSASSERSSTSAIACAASTARCATVAVPRPGIGGAGTSG